MDEKEAEQKSSLRNEKLKVNRASETEGQRKEWLRIRNEKDRARRYKRKIKGLTAYIVQLICAEFCWNCAFDD